MSITREAFELSPGSQERSSLVEEGAAFRSWKRFRLTQKSLTDFASRIRSLQRDKSIPIAIAYGSWANIAGKPGAHCNKGAPPCIGKGLRSKLSKHFCIVVTPEQYTSKTCSLCCSVCDSCRDVDACHRERMLESLRVKGCNDSNCIRKAMRFSVRGLRRCQNNACAAYLNRDYSASVNIQRRSLLLSSQRRWGSCETAEHARRRS